MGFEEGVYIGVGTWKLGIGFGLDLDLVSWFQI